jgi:hypothetical protein
MNLATVGSAAADPRCAVADEPPADSANRDATGRREAPRLAARAPAPQTTPAEPRAPAASQALAAPARVKRGGSLPKCATDAPFRECRGGALQSSSWSYDPFDEYGYAGERGIDPHGACEGWIREAMQRIDGRLRVV